MRQILLEFLHLFFKKLLVLAVMAITPAAFAQSGKSSSSVSVTQKDVKKTEQDEKDQAKNKSTNKSMAQGLSVAEAALLNESPWGFYATTSVSRGLDEYADTLLSDTSLSLSYRLNSKSSLGLSTAYSTIMYKRDGALFDNADPDPGQYGFDDTEVSYILPGVWSDKYNRLMMTGVVTLPTSRASNRAGLNVDGRVGAILRYRPNSRLMVTPSVSVYGRSYRYDSNAMGTLFNSPAGINYGLALAYTFRPWLITTFSYGQTQRYEYNGDWNTIQTGIVQANISATDSINGYLGYRWRDRLITNDAMFDDDKSLIYTGVGYAF